MGNYPIIENIHQKVFEAASKEGALEMNSFHKCETTHCRFGWVEVLAGEAGRQLAAKTSIMFAAMMIYQVSSPITVPPTMAFVSNVESMEDMRRCAEEEKNAQQ